MARFKEWLLRQRGPVGRLKFFLESILVVAGTLALVLGIWHHFESHNPTALPGEGKRVVAFRQLANRICTENRQNQRRAQKRGGSEVARLGRTAQVLGWSLSDLEGITAPPTRFSYFVAEVRAWAEVRRQIVRLRRAVQSGQEVAAAAATAALRSLEGRSRELAREAGVVRCTRILPKSSGLFEAGLAD